jgi:hypothetical protein
VAVELVLLLGFIGLPIVADTLDHAPPPWPGAVVAVLAAPAVLAADAIHKRLRASRRAASPVAAPSRPAG